MIRSTTVSVFCIVYDKWQICENSIVYNKMYDKWQTIWNIIVQYTVRVLLLQFLQEIDLRILNHLTRCMNVCSVTVRGPST